VAVDSTGDFGASTVAFGLAVVVVVVVLVLLLTAPLLLLALLQPASNAQANRKMRIFANFIERTPLEKFGCDFQLDSRLGFEGRPGSRNCAKHGPRPAPGLFRCLRPYSEIRRRVNLVARRGSE
jgi:hypothetical protein